MDTITNIARAIPLIDGFYVVAPPVLSIALFFWCYRIASTTGYGARIMCFLRRRPVPIKVPLPLDSTYLEAVGHLQKGLPSMCWASMCLAFARLAQGNQFSGHDLVTLGALGFAINELGKGLWEVVPALFFTYKWGLAEGRGAYFVKLDNGELYKLYFRDSKGDYLYDSVSYEQRKDARIRTQTEVSNRFFKNLVLSVCVYFPLMFYDEIIDAVEQASRLTVLEKLHFSAVGLFVRAALFWIVCARFFSPFFVSVVTLWATYFCDYVTGARVKDRKPIRKGRAFAEAQEAHGSSSFADEMEAARRMRG